MDGRATFRLLGSPTMIAWVLFANSVGSALANVEPVLQVSGYVHLQEHNPKTGSPWTNQQSQSFFLAVISGDQYRLCVTNVASPRWWAQFVYDGTNSYTLLPFSDALRVPYGRGGDLMPPDRSIPKVIIAPSGQFVQSVPENLGLQLVWLTYGFRSVIHKTNANGAIDMPLSVARRNPGAYGYEWVVKLTEDGTFLKECLIRRNAGLDLPDAEELLRSELNYPESQQEYDMYRDALAVRKAIPTGYVKARYICTQWRDVGGVTIPFGGEMEVGLDPVYSKPFRIAKLQAIEATVLETLDLLPKITATTTVEDYRYKRTNHDRIFKYAEYTLQPGDSWRDHNDEVLLAQASAWLSHGRKYFAFPNRKKTFIALAFAGTAIVPLFCLAVYWRKQTKNKPQEKPE
jgi:hypothetical protein